MENREQSVGEGIAEEIFDAALVYEAHERPEPRPFLPWHRPRKQLVREQQWIYEIEQLVTASPPEHGEIRYLGLPGIDLLDLRCIRQMICDTRDLKLRYLGFNSGVQPNSRDHEEMTISEDEVKRSRLVHELSLIRGDDFTLLGQRNSLAQKAALSHGPFDVINIDLCDGFGTHPPARLNATYYDAVNSLCAIQVRRTRPWLLFLTTRTDRPTIDGAVLELFLEKYRANLADHADFTTESDNRFGISCEATLAEACGTDNGHLRVFLTALCKWLIGIALANAPTDVRLKSVVGYSVADGPSPDLMSLAFLFTPTVVPGEDPMRLARVPDQAPTEGLMAVRALRRVSALRDADEILSNDDALQARMTDNMAALLAEARYDPEAYREWVRKGAA
ncbi:PP_RS20740 family protein [Luteimonas sp. RIT-PG2_3]